MKGGFELGELFDEGERKGGEGENGGERNRCRGENMGEMRKICTC